MEHATTAAQPDLFERNINRAANTYSSGMAEAGWDYGYGSFSPISYAAVYLDPELNGAYTRHLVIVKAKKRNPNDFKPYVLACNAAMDNCEVLEPWNDFATLEEAKAAVPEGYTLIA